MNATQLTSEFNLQACTLLDQSLKKIIHCLGQLDDGQCWRRPLAGMNSIGNLLLHINGNLRQWSITAITQQIDHRRREQEFSPETESPKSELLELTRRTVVESKNAIGSLSADQLLDRITVQGFKVNMMQAILHTTTHFMGHTHQIILLTRWQLGDEYRFEWDPENGTLDLPM